MFPVEADVSPLSSSGLVARLRRKGSRRRSWCSRTRRPAGCGCAPAPTPPPRSWCWTPVSRRTCWTASTPATPTWFASPACQVGRRCSILVFKSLLSLQVGFVVSHPSPFPIPSPLLQACWSQTTLQAKRSTTTWSPARATVCRWRVAWPVLAPQAATAPWRPREPPPSPRRPVLAPRGRLPSRASSRRQVLSLCVCVCID